MGEGPADGLWSDEDFAGWYPRDGRPGLSPAQLATVCVLQFLLGLSDRQAAEAVRHPADIDPSCLPSPQRRLTGVDEMVLSLSAKGLTHGEISAHLADTWLS